MLAARTGSHAVNVTTAGSQITNANPRVLLGCFAAFAQKNKEFQMNVFSAEKKQLQGGQ